MSEYALARGPITPTPPQTELAGWAISGRRADAPLTLADWTPLAKLLLRSPRVPTYGRSRDPDTDHNSELVRGPGFRVRYGAAAHEEWAGVDVLLVGRAPDEWLALGPPGSQPDLLDRLRPAGSTVVDVTHTMAMLRLTGDRAPDVLARECALDLSDRSAPHGSAFRTAVSHVAAGLVRDDIEGRRSYLVTCEWSLGHYLYESLLDAGAEWGIEVDGLRITQS